MKIEKGIVKYKDRNDIVCTYGTTEEGTKYYFLDETDNKKFTNGNRIVSSLLVEAIDSMVKASNVGVIDNAGGVVIPCVNRSIRVVDDNTIIVEVSNPVSQSVIDANELKSDPLSATKLVSTPATIKDKLNQKMGTDGKYLFNDQFSEATICDIDGNNLVDNEYYSFIAQANGKLYMSKNVVDSDIKEYALTNSEENVEEKAESEENAIDVSEVNVDSSVVEEGLANAGFSPEDMKEDSEAVSEENTEASDVIMAPDDSVPPVVGDDEAVQETPEDAPVNIFENNTTFIDPETVGSTVDKDGNGINDSLENGNGINGSLESDNVVDIFKENDNSQENKSADEVKPNADIGALDSTTDYSSFSTPMDSYDSTSYGFAQDDQYDSLFSSIQGDRITYGEKDIMGDVIRSMSDLMRQNKDQRNVISKYKERLDNAEAQKRVISDQLKQQASRIDSLANKLRTLEENSARLDSRNQMLENKLRDQEKIIAMQDRELRALRPGKQDLVKLLADAKALLGNDDNFSYSDTENYYRRVA